ncbi:MAG: spore gernimation protein GerC [Firmicutes bacterium]|nr:spore gernimation protein GerC [Bacillota bacterium]
MNRKFLISLLLIISIATTGCWDAYELNQLAIVSALGIDKDTAGYIVSLQVLNPGQISGKNKGSGSPVTTYTATGATIWEAGRKLYTEYPRVFTYTHLKVVILGENMAREGIAPILDFITRCFEMRMDYVMLVARNSSAKDILSVLTPAEVVPAEALVNSLKLSQKVLGETSAVTVDEFVSMLVTEGKDPVAAGVKISGEANSGEKTDSIKKVDMPAAVTVAPLGVFKKDRLVGWLNERDSKGYNYITGKGKDFVSIVTMPQGGKVEMKILKTKVALDAAGADQQPEINLEMEVEGTIDGISTDIDLLKEENIRIIEGEEEKEIGNIIAGAIRTAQKQYSSDIFGFGDVIHRTNYRAWESLRDNWDESFRNLPVNIKVKVRIVGTCIKANSILAGIKR